MNILENAYLAMLCYAQTLPNLTPPIGKINPSRKTAVTLKQKLQLTNPLKFRLI